MIYFGNNLRVSGFDEYNLVLEEHREIKSKEGARMDWAFLGYYPSLSWLHGAMLAVLKVSGNPTKYGLLDKKRASLIEAALRFVDLEAETEALKGSVQKRIGVAEKTSQRMKELWANKKKAATSED